MPRFMKSLAVIILLVMLIGSFILGNVFAIDRQYNTILALSGVLTSVLTFALLYSIGYAIECLNDIRNSIADFLDEVSDEEEDDEPMGEYGESEDQK